jgi:hypothetical protein
MTRGRTSRRLSGTGSDAPAVRVFAASRDLFPMLGQADGRRIAQLLLERCTVRDRARVEVLITAGLLAMMTADSATARELHSAARTLSAELGDGELEGFATLFRGLAETLDMAVEPARVDLDTARSLHRRAGTAPARAWPSRRSASLPDDRQPRTGAHAAR